MEPKITIKRDKYSRLTYIVETEPGAPFLYRRIIDMPAAIRGWAADKIALFLAERRLELIQASPGSDGPLHMPFYDHNVSKGPGNEFRHRLFDWARAELPTQLIHNAQPANGGLFTVTSDLSSWYVVSPITHQLRCVGRAKGKGANYHDKAVKLAAQMSQDMVRFYRALPRHERAA